MNILSKIRIFICTVILAFSAPSAYTESKTQQVLLVCPLTFSGDPSYSWTASGITDSISSDFVRVPLFMVVSREDRKKVIEEMELAMTGLLEEKKTSAAGKMVAADFLVNGSCSVSGNSLRVSVRLINAENGAIAASVDMKGSIDSLFEIQNSIAYKLLAEFEKKSGESSGSSVISGDDPVKQQHGSMEAYTLYALGLAAEINNIREALQFFLKAIELKPEYYDALSAAGRAYSDMEKYSDALAYFTAAQSILEKSGETSSLRFAEALQNTSKALRFLKRKNEALELCLKSREIFEKLNRMENTEYAVLLNQLGVIYGDMNDNTKQVLFFKKSKELFEMLGRKNSIGYAIVLYNTAAKKPEEKIDNLLLAKKIFENIGYYGLNYVKVLNRIGEEYDGMNLMANADKSLPFYLKGIVSLEKRGQTKTILYLDILHNAGNGYIEKEKYCEALGMFVKEKEISLKVEFDKNPEERRKKIENSIKKNNLQEKCGGK